jgi:hypothetical protein
MRRSQRGYAASAWAASAGAAVPLRPKNL